MINTIESLTRFSLGRDVTVVPVEEDSPFVGKIRCRETGESAYPDEWATAIANIFSCTRRSARVRLMHMTCGVSFGRAYGHTWERIRHKR